MVFTKVNSKVVKVNVAQAGGVVARTGAMLFYTGDVAFAPHQVPGSGQMGGIARLAGNPSGRAQPFRELSRCRARSQPHQHRIRPHFRTVDTLQALAGRGRLMSRWPDSC